MVASWPNTVKAWTPLVDDPTNTSKDPQALASSSHIQEVRDEVSAIEASLNNDAKYSVVQHEAKADPHPQYMTQAEGDARYAVTGATGFMTQTQADARYVLQGADPLTIYYNAARGDARYLQIANAFTQTAADARYPLKTDSDPYPQYMTQSEGDARYPLATASDPYPQYLTQAEGDARYAVLAHTHTRRRIITATIKYPPDVPDKLNTMRLYVPAGGTTTVQRLSVRKNGGTTVTGNAQKNGALLAATDVRAGGATDLDDTWTDAAALQNQACADGDTVDLLLQGYATMPNSFTVQVELSEAA